MSSLIVIRIVPETAVDAGTFTNYLTALGGLRIRAFDLSFNSPTTGQNVGTATYIAPTTPPSPTSPVLFTLPAPGPTIKPPKYPAGTTNGIVQQYDQVPGQSLGPITESSFFELKSVATAVIQVSAPTAFENLRLEVQWGSGAGSQSIPVTTDYYDVALAPGPSPNPNFWAALPPSLYLSLPAPPASANAVSVSLPSDGTPPPFDSLLSAVKGVLNLDPGGTPDIGKLTPDQCRNIAYEIVWGQQKPVPAAPDRIEDLYTNPPNKGVFLSGSTPNQLEADRQQFEANLKSYYTTADATADRLTNYVYSLAAAVACEEQCLKARQAILDFPANPSQAGPTPTSSTEIILTAFGGVNPPVNFGVPAAYFYALGASMPPQITPTQRFRMASGDKPQHVLAQLTAAINARTVSDAEKFATLPAAPSINAAQAARRIIALGVPVGSTTPLAPLDTITLQTSGDTPAGSTLPFSSTTGVSAGMSITGANIPADTTVLGVTTTSVTMSQPVSGDVPKGASIIFTPAFSADLRQLVQAWLAYPPSAAPPAPPSSQTYQPDDDAAQFWPGAATAHASAFLNLVLCALTKGYFIPAPVNASLGDKIVSGLLAPLAALPTIATLASVTDEQWNGFFQKNPTWLPPFTKPGNTAARTAAFIRYAQKFFAVVAAGPPSSINVATSAATLLGNVLHFTSTAGIAAKMSVAATNLPSGTIPGGTTVTGVTATSVTLSQPLAGTVPSGANITFTPNFLSGTSRTLPLLQAPSTDWLSVCLGFYGAYTLGSGFDVDKLTAAAAQVFADDQEAQDWLVDALVTIDSLYQILNSVPLPPTNPKNFEFSLAEALYARGFTSAEDITELSSADFQQALTGTVAYDLAGDIYDSAAKIAPPEPTPPPPGDGFQPVNPDGSLTNCIPPACLSPLGPVAYLSDMLRASENSTCDDPFASPDEEHTTLGGAIAGRRNLGGLEATCANLETPIPLIDIVNECLENLAVETPSTAPVAYNTSATTVAGHDLCKENHCTDELKDDCCSEEHNKDEHCHKPASLLATLPEHSSPATPVAQPGAYDRLKSDFSSCCLPYSQPLDLARSYLAHMRTCRHEDMRTFRKNITEFALDSSLAPPVFQAHLWRYPVRIEIAIEYLGLTPEEYAALFNPGDVATATLYGFGANDEGWTETVVQLPEFLKRTCLTYCEFVELQRALQGSQIVEFVSGDEKGFFPDCEPCCLGEYEITFASPQDTPQALRRLAIFIRVWRKLKEVCGARYCFAELRDICEVLGLFTNTGINPNFIRQLAAFQILRDQFTMPLADRTDQQAGATDAERSHLLALWVGPAAPKWNWAVEHLLARVQHHAQLHHKAARRLPEFIKLLAENLDPLSRLAGFDPDRPSDTWHARPANTLRFAEVLAKISASHFSVGEIVFLFTADEHLDGDDPFPLQELNEALDSPLGLPDDEHEHSLLALRRKLLSIRVPEEEAREWTWHRIEASLRSEFGYAPPAGSPDALTSLAEHFFPHILESYGQMVDAKKRQYRVDLAGTPPLMWNTPADGPFRYDASAQQLWTKLPLQDEAVIEKLSSMRQLTPAEQQAVQDLYYLPRLDLVPFAFLFADFRSADERLIQEKNEEERWTWFRGHFALAHARCRIIAEHLACHAQNESERQWEDANETAWLILKRLFADENRAASSWEDDSGKVPQVTWTPQPNGGAFAALLGLTGTGLLGEFTPIQGGVGYREVPGPMRAFGHDRNRKNCPVPTVLPTMDLTLTPAQASFITARNGFAMKDEHGTALGGAQGFTVHWTGVLLVDKEGRYEFRAGAPTPEGEKPDFEAAEHRQWKVTLKRGQKTWVLLRHHWEEEEPQHTLAVALKCGAYHITVEFTEPAPRFTHEEGVRPLHTGFEIKYTGPDSDDRWIALPLHQLFRETKDDTLQQGIDTLSGKAADFLQQQFTSTLRDIRRTYQRAFKALLFAIGFELSGKRAPHYGQSELGYMLDDADLFAGVSYYRDPTLFSKHLANFDFNFLPLRDNYQPPAPVQDLRVQPTVKREQALFDWWERSFDYVQMREQTKSAHQHPLWLLFEEATEQQPDNAGHLLRHMDVDFRYAQAVLHYFIDQTVPLYEVTSNDLKDDRWAVRVWHSNQFVRRLVRHFHVNDLRDARPYLWASDDPGMAVSGETRSGNENLTKFVCDGCFENGEPRRYHDVKRLNDRLREHARCALIAYLCSQDRVPLPWPSPANARSGRDLSDLLLLDVEAGLCEKASRIEEAIGAIQSFVQRARLGLEPGWSVNCAFARMWDRQFATFHIWQACKRRDLYKENWIEWSDLEKARRVEAFRFLESELCSSALTVAVPGGLEWWPDERPPAHSGLEALQKRQPTRMQLLEPAREGLKFLATPERDARPSWLATVAASASNDRDVDPRAATGNAANQLPFWMEAAIRLGTRFYRIAAAGVPPAGMGFEPHKKHHGEKSCVECCDECGCSHPVLVDEYYFWLVDGSFFNPPTPPSGSFPTTSPDDYQYGYQDDYYDPNQQQSTFWQDPNQLPQLLEWQTAPMVRLAWCRVHNGEFQQPRRSAKGVAVTAIADSDLTFQGRVGDSLTFSVSNPAIPSPQPGYLDTSDPGFRYDLATDYATVLPLITAPPSPGVTYPGGLPAYPYFVYDRPGTHLFPLSLFSPALAVGSALRTHCRFEAALKWYQLVFDPLRQDCTWVHCPDKGPSSPPPAEGDNAPTLVEVAPKINVPKDLDGSAQGACCDSTNISCADARTRSIVLHYLETLLEWGDATMRRSSPEAFQRARLIFDTASLILGQQPWSVLLPESLTPQTVTDFKPFFAPLNPRLLDLYDILKDRLSLIHACLNSRRLPNGRVDCEMPYFGIDPLSEGWRSTVEPCAEDAEWCYLHSPYRFIFLVQKAQDFAARLKELGGELLAAFEKGDAEYLASVRAGHERELLTLGLASRKDQWRESDWQVEALQKTKAVSQANLAYYNGLIQTGLINDEIQYQDLTITSTVLRAAGDVSEGIAAAVGAIPNMFTGIAGFGGTPLFYTQLPVGTPLASIFATAARIMNGLAEIATSTAGLQLTEGGWQRRSDEWAHQAQILTIEIEQMELQILAAQRKRDQMLLELNSFKRQMEQSKEIHDFFRDKFTAHDLYLFLQKETAALYYKTYDLTVYAARQAERAFNVERGYTARRFIPECAWNSLQEGLMAGKRLEVALRLMEKAYLDENVREYELTKHFSLRLHFPMEFLRLRIAGCCEIELPEWMFDLDFPGHYMRRIKNVTLTIPCVTGPYTGVHCRLTLISSVTRKDPRLSAPPHHCCCPSKQHRCADRELEGGYAACADDPRMVRQYAAKEAIATSSGQNDSGMFELNFRDERYLPFEFLGAVSRWRIELPLENNYFDMDTLSDMILHLNYTAREGGELLRHEASEVAQCHLPGNGWAYFDVRHEFPDAWELFREACQRGKNEREIDLKLLRHMFPFVPGNKDLWITKLALFFETVDGDGRNCLSPGECPCPTGDEPACHLVEFTMGCDDEDDDELEELTFACSASCDWPGLYHGVLDASVGPLHRQRGGRIRLEFLAGVGMIRSMFLFCRYELRPVCDGPRAPRAAASSRDSPSSKVKTYTS